MAFEYSHQDSMKKFMEQLTPRVIVEYLDKFIIGQSDAKRAIAVALRNRYRRMMLPQELRESISPKNLLMIGPTGVGKTEIARRISRLIGAPFIKVEATKYTEVGYVGRDVESMIRDLMSNSLGLVKKEMQGSNKTKIQNQVEKRVLQEILQRKHMFNLESLSEEEIAKKIANGDFEDKELDIQLPASNPLNDMIQGIGIVGIEQNIPPDVFKMFSGQNKKKKVKLSKAREVFEQEEMNKIADEDKIQEMAKWRAEEMGIIFIDEFDKIISSQSVKGNESVSREGVQRDILPIVEGSQVQTRYGLIDTSNVLFLAAGAFHLAKPSDLIPELQGRFPIRVELKELHQSDFVRILHDTENSLVDQYSKLLSTEGLLITMQDSAIQAVAEIAYKMNTESENIGARRLYTVMEKLFETLMFDASDMADTSLVIDTDFVQTQLKGIFEDIDFYKYIL